MEKKTERKTVLIVDDSAALRRIVADTLNIFDFNLLQAENAATAEELLKSHDVDLILLDWIMPGKSGYELFVDLRKREKLREIPVIMLSAGGEGEMMLKAIRSGIKHYLTKPFTHEDLLARVTQVLKMDL